MTKVEKSMTPETATPAQGHLRALAAKYYADNDVLKDEIEKLFFRTWQYACHTSELAEPGSYVAVSLLGQNIFVTRDQQGDIRAYYNVCPHRGHKLVEGSGKKSVIVCPYHQWSFTLDGNLRSMRQVSTSDAPERDKVCLTEVRVDTFLDFVLINLDPDAEPVSEFWPGMEEHVRETCPDLSSYKLSVSASVIQPVDVAANWKVQIDNFLECQHCRHGHVSFADMLDINGQKTTLFKNGAYNFIPSSGKADNLAHPLDPEHDLMDLHFWHLFPNMGVGQFSGPGNFGFYQWLPLGPDRAIRISVSLDVAEPTDPGMEERQRLRTEWVRETLQREDVEFMESVQEGMHQKGFDQGWYIVDWDNQEFSEAMMQHFHTTYLEWMEGDKAAD